MLKNLLTTYDFKSAGTPDGRRFKSAGNLSDAAFRCIARILSNTAFHRIARKS